VSITLEEALGLPPTPTPTREVTQLTPCKIAQAQRDEIIVAKIVIQRIPIETVGKEHSLSSSQIYRIIEEWAKTQQAIYLQVEWYRQYEEMKKINPVEAFRNLTKVMTKILEKQAKIEVNVSNNQLNMVNAIPALLKERLDEIIKESEESCIDHPAHREKNHLVFSVTPQLVDNET